MFIIRYRKIFYILSAFLVVASIVSLGYFGLQFGIDFKGGSLIEVSYLKERPALDVVKTGLDSVNIPGYSIRPTGEQGYILRAPFVNEETHLKINAALSVQGKNPMEEKRFDAVGPTLGSELARKAILSIVLVILAIVLFITFAFRKVSEPVSSWKYGFVAIVCLVHDVVIPAGAFAILGRFMGVEVDALFVTALLVVLGFSIHDTIVVFDRIRENLRRNREFRKTESFDETVGRSLNQTFVRSVNTSLTTLLALVALYFIGSVATQHFALALFIGIAAGTYSSLFVASPLLVSMWKRQNN